MGNRQNKSKATQNEEKVEVDYSQGFKLNKKMSVEDYELLVVVGKGSFGKVMQVKKKDTQKIYAMKVLKKKQLVQRKQVDHTRTERKVLAEIDHPFIVSLRYAFQTDEKLYMILDYFNGGELFYHLKNEKRFTESRAKFYTSEIVLALECLHERNIIYRDLKPENILLDADGHVKITDFGLSKEAAQAGSLTHTFCGTPEYLAPELLQGRGHGKGVDWWSLGTLLYEMLTGLPPFYNPNLNVMYDRILHATIPFPKNLSKGAKTLLAGLLHRDPNQRLGNGPTGTDDVKSHPFFKDIDFDKLRIKEIKPPFKPNLKSTSSVEFVDEVFTVETPKDTPVNGSSGLSAQAQFPNFTYMDGQSPGSDGIPPTK